MRIIKLSAAALLALLIFAPATLAARSYLGFFGGITEGQRLPLTTEIVLQQAGGARGRNNNNARDFVYTEMVFLAGVPVEFNGNMSRRVNGAIAPAGETEGTATVQYIVSGNGLANADGDDVNIARNLTLGISWRREGNQVIENYSVNSWTETITVNGEVFALVPSQSHINVSILRDITPGVTYFRGDISKRAVYQNNGDTIIKEVIGQIYGFESAWSMVETHRLNVVLSTPEWQMQYQVVPSVMVSKDLQYAQAEPTLISFAGNYREVMSNQSGLNYIIHTLPNQFYGTPTSGRAAITSFNSFEQLIAPDMGHLRGHWSERDARQLFSMEILRGDPNHFRPYQGITRSGFITMLARAVKLPLDPAHLPGAQNARGGRNQQPVNLIFPDVWPERPDFAYIMAAHNVGIAIGRGDGHFHSDEILTRQEAYVLALRMLGLSNLGMLPTPITPFVDDAQIGDWARQDIYAAARIGLILPDEEGMIHPRRLMTMGEASALVLRLIDYMRHELARDYTENIINFLN